MKFKIDNYVLMNAVKMIAPFVPNKSPIASAECIYIEAKQDGCVWLRSFDPMGAACALFVNADVSQDGTAFVNAKTFVNILGKMDDRETEIDCDEKICNIAQGEAVFSLGVISDEYTKPNFVDGESIEIDGNEFVDLINGVAFAAASDQSVHRGIKFVSEMGTLTAVALDGYRMAIRTVAAQTEKEFIIPAKFLDDLRKVVSGKLKIFVDKKAARFQIDSFNITVPLLAGQFLDYQSAMPKACKTVVKMSKADIVRKLERIDIINAVRVPIVMEFKNSECKISTQNAVSAARDVVPCEIKGDELKIAFNSLYLLDALKRCDEEITLELNGAIAPAVMRGEGYYYLVLPVRVRE